MTEKRKSLYMRIGVQIRRYFSRLRTQLRKCWSVIVKGSFVNKEEEPSLPTDSTFYKERIIALGYVLKNKSLSLEIRAQAAKKIGLLAFTGGPGAEKLAAEYMKEVAHLLQNDIVAPRIKILLLKGVACWWYLNPGSQKMTKHLNFIHILTGLLESPLEYSVKGGKSSLLLLVKFWTCYALCVLVYNNLSFIGELKNYNALKYNLQILASENWFGWPENFAELLHHLICLYSK
ncbi:PREDICTED: uncharacterized protein C6orf229 homolog [Chinchilla lanigera]|uniref:Armadillo like helical domain containing 2 n=1 Tax=Chinchilla lanigera TaxID=34839 RepID=A0A8C2UKS5_CHILA|nr:PREDICTED: uncharacterized protein C6orf229 homolog [Chinchilla lanigera]